MTDLGRRLRRIPLPEEAAARERARRTVLAAHAALPPRRRRHARTTGLAFTAAVLGLAALTGPGQAVVGAPARAVRALVDDVVPPSPTPRPLPAHRGTGPLPLAGRLLVAGGRGAWVLDHAGAHRLGAWTTAAWSPRGVFIVVAEGRTLAAVDPAGHLRWRLVRRAPVTAPRWAPDGTHIAYRSGRSLRVVYGNGTHDRLLARAAAPAAPAWRPGAPHDLAWAARDSAVRVTDVDTGRTLWWARAASGRGSADVAAGVSRTVTLLAWSAAGRRLLVAGPRGGRIHDLARGRTEALHPGRGRRLLAAAWSPRGTALALATAGRGRAEIRLRGRHGPLFSAGGRLTSLVWSPDGRWLAADWPTAREWLLVRVLGRPRVEAVTRYGGALRPQEWCCVG